MAGISKNNPDKRAEKKVGRYALSDECRACKVQCLKGRRYLRDMAITLMGKGVWCTKEG